MAGFFFWRGAVMAQEDKQEGRSRRDMEAQIIAKAWSDEAFMEELRCDPRAAISKELGTDLPDGLKVVVRQETREDPTWNIVIPVKPSGELSDDELAAAAGGADGRRCVHDPYAW